MAYSTLKIIFYEVPFYDDVLNFSETKSGLNLNAIFKDIRQNQGQVQIPTFFEYDGTRAEQYKGYISSNYKTAFDLDYNTSNLFTVKATSGPSNSGLGEVLITANFSEAVFVLGTSSYNVDVLINNEAYTPTPTGVITYSPASISFKHEQNTVFETIGIAMSGDLWKVVGKPNFVLLSETAGVTVTSVTDESGTYQTAAGSGEAILSITPTDYYNGSGEFITSDLSGSFFVLKDNVAYGAIPFTMVVTRITDFLTNPYPASAKAFTLDTKFFEFRSNNPDTYFQFDSTIRTYDFVTNVEHEFSIPLKIVLFQGYAKENLGQIIHRLMQKFTAVNDSLVQYKQALLNITCSEVRIADTTIIRSGTIQDIPFIAGLSRGITTLGFLDFNAAPNRVTKNSFAYLNILIPTGSYELRTLKNGMLVSAEALPASTGVVLCKKVFFNNYAQGDRIQFVIDIVGSNTSNAPKKTYVLFPDNNYSNMIVWENEFLLQSAIECTGSASINPEGEFQSQTVYVDLVERLEHLSSSKTVKLFINTGWLLLSDIDTIESLMRSKRAWLIQGNTIISLRPISKKLPKKDLEEELISYPLEFQINQTYNEETYSL